MNIFSLICRATYVAEFGPRQQFLRRVMCSYTPTSVRDPSSTTHKPPWSEQGQDCDFYRGHLEQRAKRRPARNAIARLSRARFWGFAPRARLIDPVGRFSREPPGQTFCRLGAAQFYFSGRPPATLTARGRDFSHVRGRMLRQQSN